MNCIEAKQTTDGCILSIGAEKPKIKEKIQGQKGLRSDVQQQLKILKEWNERKIRRDSDLS